MFTNTQATAMLPARDAARAKSWYADKLGLKPVEDFAENGAAYDIGGTRVFLYPTQFAGTAQHTVLSFSTDDLAGDMKSLRARGVSFLDYDLPDLKTEGGVAEFGGMKTAWCKDSEGNILGFVEGESVAALASAWASASASISASHCPMRRDAVRPGTNQALRASLQRARGKRLRNCSTVILS